MFVACDRFLQRLGAAGGVERRGRAVFFLLGREALAGWRAGSGAYKRTNSSAGIG